MSSSTARAPFASEQANQLLVARIGRHAAMPMNGTPAAPRALRVIHRVTDVHSTALSAPG